MEQEDMLRETYRLSLENNRMLHSMKRSAFVTRVLMLVWYAVLLGVPIWLYITYLFPVVQQLQSTLGTVQTTGAAAQVQVSNFENAWEEFKARFAPGTTTAQ